MKLQGTRVCGVVEESSCPDSRSKLGKPKRPSQGIKASDNPMGIFLAILLSVKVASLLHQTIIQLLSYCTFALRRIDLIRGFLLHQ